MLAERYLSNARAAEVLGQGVMHDEPPGQQRFIRQQAAERSPGPTPDHPASGDQHGFGPLWQRVIRWARSRSGRSRP